MDPESYYRDEGVARLAGISRGTKAVPRVRATGYICKMRGASRPHLLRCDDGEYYVVKFRNNPQHVRILANEMLASRLALLIGLPVPQPAFVNVPMDFVEQNPALRVEMNGRVEPCAAGLQFGCRYAGDPHQVSAVDFLPDPLLKKVSNLDSAFPGAFVFDKWTCNCDARQAVFYRSAPEPGWSYTVLLIDQGFCFNAEHWNFPDSPVRSLYPRRLVYDSVTSLESFEPFLSKIKNLQLANIEACVADIPSEWCSPEPGELELLVRRLHARRKRIAELIIDSKTHSHHFRHWV
jgi:hypothetical protein